MSVEFIIFAAASLVSIGAAILVISQKNPVASALFLIVTLVSQAILYLLLGAVLVAVLQILVYAGAIMVLFLFVIMLLNLRRDEFGADRKKIQRLLTAGLALFLMIEIALVIKLSLPEKEVLVPVKDLTIGSPSEVGRALFTDYLFPFELTSFLLLVAMLGAVVLAKKRL